MKEFRTNNSSKSSQENMQYGCWRGSHKNSERQERPKMTGRIFFKNSRAGGLKSQKKYVQNAEGRGEVRPKGETNRKVGCRKGDRRVRN